MPRKTALLIFFLAGLSALIYEITWVRQATLIFGVSIYAYSAVLMAYMGGLALGSYAIGPGPVVQDANAFFVSDGRETGVLVKLLQTAAMKANR